MECEAFNPSTTHSHNSFLKLKTNMIHTLNEPSLKEWMVERFAVQLQPLTIAVAMMIVYDL